MIRLSDKFYYRFSTAPAHVQFAFCRSEPSLAHACTELPRKWWHDTVELHSTTWRTYGDGAPLPIGGNSWGWYSAERRYNVREAPFEPVIQDVVRACDLKCVFCLVKHDGSWGWGFKYRPYRRPDDMPWIAPLHQMRCSVLCHECQRLMYKDGSFIIAQTYYLEKLARRRHDAP